MKKILLAAPLLALFFTACNPIVEEVGMDSSVSADDLSNSFELVAKSEGNNNITVSQSTARNIKVCSAYNYAVVV